VNDLLANCEREPSARPTSKDEEQLAAPERKPWLGSVHSEIEHWRRRALKAEGLVDRLLASLRAWRPHT
jgi:hypothetical protein